MSCEKCIENPFFHHFLHVGNTEEGYGIYYSKFSLNVEKQFREEAIPQYLSHMDKASHTKWIWIFDSCGLDKMEMPNPFVVKKFFKLLQERYKHALLKIYIFDVNWKVSFLLQLIHPLMAKDMRNRIQECKTPLELLSAKIPSLVFRDICSRLEGGANQA
jgi:hypothetical protein